MDEEGVERGTGDHSVKIELTDDVNLIDKSKIPLVKSPKPSMPAIERAQFYDNLPKVEISLTNNQFKVELHNYHYPNSHEVLLYIQNILSKGGYLVEHWKIQEKIQKKNKTKKRKRNRSRLRQRLLLSAKYNELVRKFGGGVISHPVEGKTLVFQKRRQISTCVHDEEEKEAEKKQEEESVEVTKEGESQQQKELLAEFEQWKKSEKEKIIKEQQVLISQYEKWGKEILSLLNLSLIHI
eukprot:TRINITY_DN5958_c0_g1_i3.p1 TRINITY_DN5958_c0_g1~~TRINITY_DN5958_c0_g1_i3.p1  ORF type:complete len:239 (+),score=53.77 TRINITY_DN5958_c0_g1_i3:66-782(+)